MHPWTREAGNPNERNNPNDHEHENGGLRQPQGRGRQDHQRHRHRRSTRPTGPYRDGARRRPVRRGDPVGAQGPIGRPPTALRGGGRQPVHRRRARRGGMGADRHASLADRSGGGGGGRGRPRAARHHHRPHRPGTHAGDHPADQQALLGAADPDQVRHAQPQARRGVPGRERTGPIARETIPYKEAMRLASDEGRFPSASGYGLIAKELSDAFAA